jgi:Uncharacterised protein family (UPF0149)
LGWGAEYLLPGCSHTANSWIEEVDIVLVAQQSNFAPRYPDMIDSMQQLAEAGITMATRPDRTGVSAMSLEDLEQYLDAYPDPRIERMGVSLIDGFLAATIVGPQLVPQARWLSQIFGATLPGSHGDRAGAAAIAAIVARHDEVRDVLCRNGQSYAPIFRTPASSWPPIGQTDFSVQSS